jgi:hypothetical protein
MSSAAEFIRVFHAIPRSGLLCGLRMTDKEEFEDTP